MMAFLPFQIVDPTREYFIPWGMLGPQQDAESESPQETQVVKTQKIILM